MRHSTWVHHPILVPDFAQALLLLLPSCLQVIQLHNAFLSAALERSLLLQADVVRHIHNLLAAAKELANVVGHVTGDAQQTGV